MFGTNSMEPPSSRLMVSYTHGPEPIGFVFRSSSVSEAGNTLTTLRRPFSRLSKGYFSVKETVLSSFADTVSMNSRKAP